MPQTRGTPSITATALAYADPFDNEFDEVATALDLRSICHAEPLYAAPAIGSLRASGFGDPQLIGTQKFDLNRTIETECPELGRYLVARGGIEPPTFRFSGGRSYRLSYLARRQRVPRHTGDPDGTRTRDLRRDRATR
jgi:hypothetical protein